MTNEEFQKLVVSKVPVGHAFRPMSIYDPDDDTIEFLTSNESYRVERVDSLVTVYYGRETKEIIGSLIKGVSKSLPKIAGEGTDLWLEIRSGRIRLVHFFQAIRKHCSKKKTAKPTILIVYEKLEQLAEVNSLETDIGNLSESVA